MAEKHNPVPKDQEKMKKFSRTTELARNKLHFSEAEAANRVSGFSKSLDHKNQLKRDYRNRETDLK